MALVSTSDDLGAWVVASADPRTSDDPAFDDSDRRAWAERALKATDSEIAFEAGVQVETVRAWRARWQLKKGKGMRGRRVGQKDVATVDMKRSLAAACRQRLPRILEVLEARLADDGEPELQLRAAGMLLDRGWGKPFRATSVEQVGGVGELADKMLAALTGADGE